MTFLLPSICRYPPFWPRLNGEHIEHNLPGLRRQPDQNGRTPWNQPSPPLRQDSRVRPYGHSVLTLAVFSAVPS